MNKSSHRTQAHHSSPTRPIPQWTSFTDCSITENVAQGHVAVGGQRMWSPYGTSAIVDAAPGATIYIAGRQLYELGRSYFLAGTGRIEPTNRLAKEAAEDAALNVTYPGSFVRRKNEVSDGCHTNRGKQKSLGQQALAFLEIAMFTAAIRERLSKDKLPLVDGVRDAEKTTSTAYM
ncbi:hypothetical protein MFIFM68171_08018 [Madurella fahalii]|uniref:Uncharacterized protein n=1 Tax=Madurella fahalii TaxID=1157608 RepID=A0ABQ0GJ71_9PEZI